MNEDVKKYLEEYCTVNKEERCSNWIQFLREFNHIYREEAGEQRWWTDYFYVVELGGRYIGFEYAEASGDASMSDLGYEIDESSICFVKKEEKVVYVYSPIV